MKPRAAPAIPPLLLLLVAGVLLHAGLAAADPPADAPDPIAERIERAKVACDAELERAKGAVDEYLDQQETTARARGDRDAVKEVAAERAAFRDAGVLPDALPGRIADRYRSVRVPLERAYERAIRDYTRSRQDAKATAAVRALADLRATPVAGGENLLKSVDLDKDVIRGRWARNAAGDLQSDPGEWAVLRLPFKVEGEYDLRVRFTRVAGRGGILLMLSYGGHQFAWEVNDSADRGEKSACGLELVDGRSYVDPENRSTVYLDKPTPVGRPCLVVAKVRKEGVAIFIDNKQVIGFRTDYRDLSAQGDYRYGPDEIGVATISASVALHSAEAIPIGPAKPAS